MDATVSSFTKRNILVFTGLVASAIGLLAAGWLAALSTSHSAVSDPRKEIEAKVAVLALKSRTGVSVPEQAAAFRSALARDDFKETARIAGDAFSRDGQRYWFSYPFADFVDSIVDYNDPTVERHLDAWVRQSAADPLPHLIRAFYEYSIGWNFRGSGFYSDIKAEDLPVFRSHIKNGLTDIDAAFKSGKQLPASAYYLKLRLLQTEGARKDRDRAFQDGIQKYPGFYPIYRLALSDLQPKWGGSIDEMYKFVDRYAGSTTQYAPLRLLYLDLYSDLLNDASMTCDRPEIGDDDKSACVASTMDKLRSADLETNVRSAFRLYNHTDRYQFGQAIRKPVQDIMSARHAAAYGVAVLQMAAAAMNSDMRLVEDHPGQNDFVIDDLVASSWYQAGHYENVLKKEEEALIDLQRTKFPDGEAKDIAVAGIYLQISRAKGKLHDYVGQASYQQASYALGGRSGYEHATCFAIFKIGTLDEALPACNEAIAANNDDMETHYWRAQVYIDRKQGDDALPDLERVAGSRHPLRGTSVIDMSMVFFGHNDNAAALGVLNKYSYLYDDKLTARDTIAIAYNNRCYAYMQLGDLRKALGDCNASLKFGNLPDAYKKKEELQKRLASLPI